MKPKTQIIIGVPSYQEVLESSQAKSTPPSFFKPSQSFSQAFAFIKSSDAYSPPPSPPPSSSSAASQKNLWLGLFYMCIPAGVALGYVFGGFVGDHIGWRWAFYIEAIAMAFFVVLSFCIKPPQQLKGFADKDPKKPSTSLETVALTDAEASQIQTETTKAKSQNLFAISGKDLKAFFCEKVFIVNVLGYITYNFVIGAYSYWGPKAGFGIYHMKNVDMIFGGLTIICGIIGTLGGSYVLDLINAKVPDLNATLPNTFKLLAASTLFGAALCFTAFCMKNMYAFIAIFALGEILIFAPQAPVNFVCLHCVRPNLRPLSMATSTVLIHILGDVPSSPLYGKMQDHQELKNINSDHYFNPLPRSYYMGDWYIYEECGPV